MGPGDLIEALRGLAVTPNPRVISGWQEGDDCGVYRLSEEVALVQTIDVITPVVDDPYLFGQVAAANALSDVYAMGATPLTALNLVCWPIGAMETSVLQAILQGSQEKLAEAEVALLGGHTIYDIELKYGLAITGTAHPARILTKAGAKPGDRLLLTKPLGTGLISTALKLDMVDEGVVAGMIQSMLVLNKTASLAMQGVGAHACTDVSGFGLLCSAAEMAEKSQVDIVIYSAQVPLLPGAEALAQKGAIPAGTQRNQEFQAGRIETAGIPQYLLNLLCDPQTSGGLLISLPAEQAPRLLSELHQQGVSQAAVVGEVRAAPRGKLMVR